MTTLGFRCRIISNKFLEFGVKILPQKNASLVFKIIKDNAQFIKTSNKGFVTTSTTVFYNLVQFSTKS